MIIVSDSSPLIAFAMADRFEVLQTLCKEITIPKEVYREVVVTGKGKPGASEVATADWIRQKEVVNKTAVQDLQTRYKIDSGEAEAIILAKELNADLLLADQKKVRGIAGALDLEVTGTIGLLVRAYEKALIKDLKTILDSLREQGFRYPDEIYDAVLKESGPRGTS